MKKYIDLFSNGRRPVKGIIRSFSVLIVFLCLITIPVMAASEPTLTATGTNPIFTEGGSAVIVFSSASASTVEIEQTLSAFTMTVTNVNDGSNEWLNLDGTAIVLTNGTSGTTDTNSLIYNVSAIGTKATLSLSGGTLSPPAFQFLVDTISYQNNSNTPNTSNRVVTITSLTDSGSNDNIAALSIASTVTVNANNDAPTLTSFASEVETTTQNTEIEITLADLKAQGNEYDVDGTVDAFIVKSLNTGTLNIGADSDSASSFNVTNNQTIDASNNAYWTPANNVIGSQNAFTTTVQDNNGAESTGAVQATVMVNDVENPEVSSIDLSGSPAVTATSITYIVTFTEPVVNVSTDDFTLTKGISANGSIASVSASSGTSMNVVVNSISGTGILRLDLNSTTDIADASGNEPTTGFIFGTQHIVDRDNPILNSSVPTDEASGVAASDNITLTFSENIVFGTGNIQIIDLDDGSSTVTIDAAAPGAQASISSNTLTLNPSSDLEENTNYAIQLAATAIDDSNGHSYAGIADNTTLNFTVADISAPLLVYNSPLDNATNVNLGENIILNFDDNMVAGAGNIIIRRTSDDTAFEQIEIGDARITISSKQITINPVKNLEKGVSYYVEIDATALDDDAGNSYAGISGNGTLNFTAVDVVINEVVTDPQQDWSTYGFIGLIGAGEINQGTDEWIELLINSDGIDFAGWTLELQDGTNVVGDFSNTGAFDKIIYSGIGSFGHTISGDYLILGNVYDDGAMNDSSLTINLKDPSGAVVDVVVIGGGSGEAPSGNASSIYNESVQRYSNGLDTDSHSNDFTLGKASLGYENIGPSVTLSTSTATIDEAADVSTITATLSAATSQNVTVTLAVDGSSTADADDYSLSSTSIVINAGSLTGTAVLTSAQDTMFENDETVIIDITGVTGGEEVGVQQKTVTINDDDVIPTVAFNASSSNGSEALGSANLQVDLSAASWLPVSVDYTVSGTASRSGIGTDYTLADGTLIIAAGDVNANITIASIVNDLLDENNETVIVTLSNATNATLGTNTVHTYTINDNDATPMVAFNASSSNGSETLGSANLQVDLSVVSGRTVTVDYTVSGTASRSGIGTDYTLADGTLIIAAGDVNDNITIASIVNDLLDENNETVIVTLSNPVNATLGTNTVHTYTINDNDATPSVAFNAISSNGSETLGSANLQVDLSAVSGRTVTVDYTVSGTASGSGTDYTLADGTLTIAAGDVNNNITIASIVNDLLDENNETVIVTLSNPVNATLGTNTVHTYTINDNDATPTISTNTGLTLNEGATKSITATELLADDADTDNATLTYTITTALLNGQLENTDNTGVSISSFTQQNLIDGKIQYVHDGTNTTSDSFIFKVSDGAPNELTEQTFTLLINRARKSSSRQKSTNSDAEVIVNGTVEKVGTVNTTQEGEKTVTTVIVDEQKLDKKLNDDVSNPVVTIPVNSKSDVVVGQLNGQTVKNMEQKETTLEIRTETVSYKLPASQINIDDVSSQIGSKVDLKDIKVSVKIAEPSEDTVKVVEDSATKSGYQIVVKPVNFEITCTSGNKTVQVSKFNGYVERTVAIPDGVDPDKITTGIVLNADGTFRHVPTQVVKINGKYFAKINSLTNSTYSVIWNPVEFTDVTDHWAKISINDMGSRMVVTGVGSSNYDPDRSITRSEFAAIVVRAMGLDEGTTESSFSDVKSSDWFNGYVDTATTYELITGYNTTSYGPNDTITREQAMTIIARAMKTTGLIISTTDDETIETLSKYTDGTSVSEYAKEWVVACLKSGVVTGTSNNTLSPKAYVTRAEVAVMVQRLLQQSELI